MQVLITGGAGYIGSHLAREVLDLGFDCYIVDDLSRGLESRIPTKSNFAKLDLCDSRNLSKFLADRKFDYVFHLAGYMQARESARMPDLYWENNFKATINLVNSLNSLTKTRFVFASSCSVYGNNPGATEKSQLNPLSIYAETKLKSEQFLLDYFKAFSKSLSIFRFFNVIGCRREQNLCDIQKETLLPSAARKILTGSKPVIFGNTYNTRDGFALREYIDVQDLAKALTLPITKDLTGIHNLSSGKNLSTLEVVETLLDISNSKNLNVEIEERKSQDPAIIGSQASQVIANLGWQPRVTLRESVENFWEVFNRYYFSSEAKSQLSNL